MRKGPHAWQHRFDAEYRGASTGAYDEEGDDGDDDDAPLCKPLGKVNKGKGKGNMKRCNK